MEPDSLLRRLPPKARAGSKARCHLFTHGTSIEVAARLTELVQPYGIVDATTHQWMPTGFEDIEEAKLGSAARLIPCNDTRRALNDWWLSVATGANTPNWDIAATCSIQGKPGCILVEAKAHDQELRKEEAGKELTSPVTANSRRNHERIGACIHEASIALSGETNMPWALSRDWNYQMSNRFAWAWRLLSLGTPVILVYLGFLHAKEMRKADQAPFEKHEDWEALVKSHASPLVAPTAWGKEMTIHGQLFVPIIKSWNITLPSD